MFLDDLFQTIDSANNDGISANTRHLIHATVISPLFITFLLFFVSGLPTAERPVQQSVYIKTHKSRQPISPDGRKDSMTDPFRASAVPQAATSIVPKGDGRWEEFRTYLDRTSILIPIPPVLYQPLPRWLKSSILLDWPIYRFNEEKEGEQLIKNHEESQAGA